MSPQAQETAKTASNRSSILSFVSRVSQLPVGHDLTQFLQVEPELLGISNFLIKPLLFVLEHGRLGLFFAWRELFRVKVDTTSILPLLLLLLVLVN